MNQMSYTTLDQRLYTTCFPKKIRQPKLVIYNKELGQALGLDKFNNTVKELTGIFSGQIPYENTSPIAQAYGGHQFGHFSILGDGRAHLIGEIRLENGQLVDCMLKGSGMTPYSRGGDGLAALGPMLREYLISEAMAGLLIPTSRSLAVVATNEPVYRETPLEGAILTRVAASHIRVGTFQYAAKFGDTDMLKTLADYSIKRHYEKEIELSEGHKTSKYLVFLREVSKRQAKLMAKWLSVGFVHGVMNTDNMAISGETIDYGPCAFMNTYHPNTVFSSIDTQGRYAYGNQPYIATWNLARLSEALLPIIDENRERAIEAVTQVIDEFEQLFAQSYSKIMGNKLGFSEVEEGDGQLIGQLLQWMQQYEADFTDTFRDVTLGEVNQLPFSQTAEFKHWYNLVKQRQMKAYANREQVEEAMKAVNPVFIPRNHLVEEALMEASKGRSMDAFHKLLELVKNPYAYTKEQLAYTPPELGYNKQYKTYCGT